MKILLQAVLDDAAKCKAKMDAASSLINGLGEERIRWTEQLAQFKSETERLVGDVLILTGFTTLTSSFLVTNKKILVRQIAVKFFTTIFTV